jgi:ribokinase
MRDVLVVGDANPDLVLRGDVVPRFGQAEQILQHADLVLAGSAAIVACGTARLGLRTALAAHVGTDSFGDLMISGLAGRGVDTSLVTRETGTPTGLSVILSTPSDRAILTLPGTIPLQRADEIHDDVLAASRHVHLASWFLIPGLAAGALDLFRRAHAAGATTSLDTNWDPAGTWDGVADVLTETDLFLPNTTELLAIAGSDVSTETTENDEASIADAARRLRAAGPLLAVKGGPQGGLGWGPDGECRATPIRVEVIDTTGAGDSFDAAFLAGWLDGRPFAECLRWAVTAGSLSTRAAGGTAAQPTRKELTASL